MRIDERVCARLATTTRFGDIRALDEVDSTNRYARDAARAGAAEGLVVVADRQSAGRGRAGRSWDASPGAGLLLSVLLRPVGLAPARLHLVTAAAGLAALAAVARIAGVVPDLKWPNDLLVGDRKLAGILAEALDVTSSTGAGAVVVGIGLNVAAAPADAVCVDELAGRPIRRVALLEALLVELEARLRSWDDVGAEYRATCATVGRTVRVEGPPGTHLTGTAVRIDADGRLVVAADGQAGERTYSVADVTHIRPANGRSWASGSGC